MANNDRKFKFISPGVFIEEVDNSQLPNQAAAEPVGPLVIGTAPKGPAGEPVKVNSFSELVEVFGSPQAGSPSVDAWRFGQQSAPTYGLYAAQAWLRNNAPLTYLRVLGEEDDNRVLNTGSAGWKAGSVNSTNTTKGGAYALCIFPNVTHEDNAAVGQGIPVTGAVAAMLYCTRGSVLLSGSTKGTTDTTASCARWMQADSDGNFDIVFVPEGNDDNLQSAKVSLNPDKSNFIRNVLNTNPVVTNTAIASNQIRSSSFGGSFWLGESFERQLNVGTTSSMGVMSGDGKGGTGGTAEYVNTTASMLLLPMRSQVNNADQQSDRQFGSVKATTGWFIAQDLTLGQNTSFQAHLQQKLFRIEARTGGQNTQRDIKISIDNIVAPTGSFTDYGSFSVVIRDLQDTDRNKKVLERFDELSLNPASQNYIARVIGDKYVQYDSTTKTNREYGNFDNSSKFVRIVMDEDVDRGSTDSRLLPFGVYGPPKYRDVSLASGSGGFKSIGFNSYASGNRGSVATMLDGGTSARFGTFGGYKDADSGDTPGVVANAAFGNATSDAFSASIIFPPTPLVRHRGWAENPARNEDFYWGVYTGQTPGNTTFNPSILDTLTAKARNHHSGSSLYPYGADKDVAPHLDVDFNIAGANFGRYRAAVTDAAQTIGAVNASSDPLVVSWVFTLDDIVIGRSEAEYKGAGYAYASGSRQNNTSLSSVSSSADDPADRGYKAVINAGFARFTTCLHGGFDGFDITERDPLRNSKVSDTDAEVDSYVLHSLKRSLNVVKDSETTSYNILTMPGVTIPQATDYALEVAEERGDALAIVDLQNVYTPDTENTSSAGDRNAFTVSNTVNKLKSRDINNSFGAAYAPWVKIQDTISNRTLWAPPSIAALGALSSNDRVAAPWFAPAGFTRGGLSEGAGGIPILDVSRRYSSEDRDSLYEANINPIAKFPAEGIVIFGQKTLQQTASALDRINVRRLLIFLKREISFIASRLLFSQNNQDTWNRFLQQATPVLESVKSQFGIDDFRLVLDSSTTTPDLVDRNIIYSKLIVKPTRSAEFFAIDFVITNSGAAFED